METTGPRTLKLMSQAIYNYIENVSLKPELSSDTEIKKQFEVCLKRLSELVVTTENMSVEFQKAA